MKMPAVMMTSTRSDGLGDWMREGMHTHFANVCSSVDTSTLRHSEGCSYSFACTLACVHGYSQTQTALEHS